MGGRALGYYGPSLGDAGKGALALVVIAVLLAVALALCCCAGEPGDAAPTGPGDAGAWVDSAGGGAA